MTEQVSENINNINEPITIEEGEINKNTENIKETHTEKKEESKIIENENKEQTETQNNEPNSNTQNIQKNEQKVNGDLIFNSENELQEIGVLFDDKDDKDYDTYEIVFKVIDSSDNPQTVVVELEKIKYKKPYYGGYVNKVTGTFYYHAYAQTDQYENKNHKIKNERSAQTYEYKTLSTTMNREFGTQMSYIGLYIDDRQDKEIKPKKYFDSEQWFNKRDSTVIYLQKMMRGFAARKLCREYRKKRDDAEAENERKEEEKRQQQEKKNKEEIKRRMHPKTSTDFRLLKKELDSWVKSETIRIKASNLSNEDKSLALQELLHKEISLLQTIEKLKISANKENRTEQISNFLQKMSADKKWMAYDGHYVNVQTVLTATAAGLQRQFDKLIAKTTVDVRLANLLEFKKMMDKSNQEHKCDLIQMILSLIEREVDMLQRGRPDSSLVGLRQRLNNLYLNYIESPLFNAEAASFQIIPKNYLLDLFANQKTKKKSH